MQNQSISPQGKQPPKRNQCMLVRDNILQNIHTEVETQHFASYKTHICVKSDGFRKLSVAVQCEILAMFLLLVNRHCKRFQFRKGIELPCDTYLQYQIFKHPTQTKKKKSYFLKLALAQKKNNQEQLF